MVTNLYPNHTFIKIEPFTSNIIDALTIDNTNLLINYSNNNTKLKEGINSPFLNTLSLDDQWLFSALYFQNKRFLDLRHHHNKNINLPNHLEAKLYFLTQDEYDLYGYEKKSFYRQMI